MVYNCPKLAGDVRIACSGMLSVSTTGVGISFPADRGFASATSFLPSCVFVLPRN